MSDEEEERDVDGVLSERFNQLFEGLDVEKAKAVLEEMFDEYCYCVFGTPAIAELRKIKRKKGVNTVSIQQLAGKAALISEYGFTVVSQTQHPKGGIQLILKENTRKDFDKERAQYG